MLIVPIKLAVTLPFPMA